MAGVNPGYMLIHNIIILIENHTRLLMELRAR